MRAGVGAICCLVREVRFLAEADFALTRLAGAFLAVELGVVELGAVFAAGLDVPVCAAASAGAKRNVPQDNSAAEM